jgi:hypothetical protein
MEEIVQNEAKSEVSSFKFEVSSAGSERSGRTYSDCKLHTSHFKLPALRPGGRGCVQNEPNWARPESKCAEQTQFPAAAEDVGRGRPTHEEARHAKRTQLGPRGGQMRRTKPIGVVRMESQVLHNKELRSDSPESGRRKTKPICGLRAGVGERAAAAGWPVCENALASVWQPQAPTRSSAAQRPSGPRAGLLGEGRCACAARACLSEAPSPRPSALRLPPRAPDNLRVPPPRELAQARWPAHQASAFGGYCPLAGRSVNWPLL